MKRKIAAIVAADVADYTRLVAKDEEETIRRLADSRAVFDDLISQHGGRIFNTAGDSVLSEFASVVEAVRAAVDIQEALRTRNLDLPPERKLQFRIGISIGDVIERDGDLLGDGVNIAARLESLATPGGICVSRSVHEAVANKISVPFRYLGEQQVKNLPRPIDAFQITLAGNGEVRRQIAREISRETAREAAKHRPARSTLRRVGSTVMLALLLGGVALVVARVALLPDTPSPAPPPEKTAVKPAENGESRRTRTAAASPLSWNSVWPASPASGGRISPVAVTPGAPPRDRAPPTTAQVPGVGGSFRDCPDCPEMAVLPAGAFPMGSGITPVDRPVHRVTIGKPFAIARTETTIAQWGQCVAEGDCKAASENAGSGAIDRPIVNVSWFDAKDYVAWLSRKTGKRYRLPSEAEWEYAAHGGTTTAFPWGANVESQKANCTDCGGGDAKQVVAVKTFPPNGYGLYEMAGNAAEWVEDCWNLSYAAAPTDGSAWLTGDCGQRVLRGGSFDSPASYIKPTARFRYDADVRYWANGFRVLRDLP